MSTVWIYSSHAAFKYLINALWLFQSTPLLLEAPEVVSSVCVTGPLTLLASKTVLLRFSDVPPCVRVCLVSSLWHGQVQFLSLRSLDGLRKWFPLPLQCTSHPFAHSLKSSCVFPLIQTSVHRFIRHPTIISPLCCKSSPFQMCILALHALQLPYP